MCSPVYRQEATPRSGEISVTKTESPDEHLSNVSVFRVASSRGHICCSPISRVNSAHVYGVRDGATGVSLNETLASIHSTWSPCDYINYNFLFPMTFLLENMIFVPVVYILYKTF